MCEKITIDEIIDVLEALRVDAEYYYAMEDGVYEDVLALSEAINIVKNYASSKDNSDFEKEKGE